MQISRYLKDNFKEHCRHTLVNEAQCYSTICLMKQKSQRCSVAYMALVLNKTERVNSRSCDPLPQVFLLLLPDWT